MKPYYSKVVRGEIFIRERNKKAPWFYACHVNNIGQKILNDKEISELAKKIEEDMKDKRIIKSYNGKSEDQIIFSATAVAVSLFLGLAALAIIYITK